MTSTLLNGQGYPPDVIERQLAHVPGNQVLAAYNRAEYLPERRKMTDTWATYLDSLRERERYKNWQNFSKVIDRAMLACKNSGYTVPDHFIEVSKMVYIW